MKLIDRVLMNSYRVKLPILLFFLLLIGQTFLFSSTFFLSLNQQESVISGVVQRQFIWVLLGIFVAITLSFTPLKWVRKAIPFIFVFNLILLALTYIPSLGQTIRGGQRWLDLGAFSLQPSELMKISLILYLAHLFDMKDFDTKITTFIYPSLVTLLILSLIYFQNDFSTTLFIATLSLSLFYLVGLDWRIIIGIIGVLGVVSSFMILSAPYRIERVISWLNPAYAPQGAGYQLQQVRRALQEGGLFGKGIGMGEIKLGLLPAVESDFVVAVLIEEAGFIGLFIVLTLFFALFFKGFVLGRLQKDGFKAMVAYGVSLSILLQVLINLAVVGGLIPATGIPLPFFSVGGSATIVGLTGYGLLINIERSEKREKKNET